MEQKTRSCLLGCGIGCGFLVIVAVIAMVVVGSQISKLGEGFEESIETREALDRAYPATRDYTPPADGAIPTERLERFLEIRAEVAPARDALREKMASFEASERKLETMEDAGAREQFREILGILSGAFSLPGAIAKFQQERDRILLDHEMGMGEYTYIFLVAHQAGGRERADSTELDGSDVVGVAIRANRRVRRDWRKMIERQAAMRAEQVDAPAEDAWSMRLRAELDRLDANPNTWPWEEGLPPETEASIAPYRDRLQALYDPAAHDIELMHSKKTGPGSFTVE